MKIIQLNNHNCSILGGEGLMKEKITNHLLSLSPEDRYLRFFSDIKDDIIKKYVVNINFSRDGVFVVFDKDSQDIIAFLHAAKIDEKFNTEYEIGLTVDKSLRGDGIGYDMFKTAIKWAKSLGCSRVFVNCLYQNNAMRKIAEKFYMETKSIDFDTKEGELKMLGIPNLFSYITHHTNNNILICDLAYKQKLHILESYISEIKEIRVV